MNNIICNYDLEFIHPNRSSLTRLMKNYSDEITISFVDSPKKDKKENFFYVKALVSCEENASFSFTDTIEKLINKIKFLELGGSFIDNIGRGYVDSFCRKQYTKTY